MPDKQTKLFRIGIRMAADQPPTEHLVRAHNLAQAKEHVTQGIVTGEVASQEDILRLATAGTKLKDATTNPEAEAASATKTPSKKA